MPDPATAIVGGIQAVSALSSSSSSDKAAKSAEKASETEIQFAQQQYDDWQNVYGPIQDNLSNYYSNLSPEFFVATGIENLEAQLEVSNKRLNESFAQRGIDPSSGIAASLESQQALDVAETKAAIRRDAPQQVADKKSQFLQIGMGSDPTKSMQNALTNQTSRLTNQAVAAGEASADATAAAIETVGTGLSDYLNK